MVDYVEHIITDVAVPDKVSPYAPFPCVFCSVNGFSVNVQQTTDVGAELGFVAGQHLLSVNGQDVTNLSAHATSALLQQAAKQRPLQLHLCHIQAAASGSALPEGTQLHRLWPVRDPTGRLPEVLQIAVGTFGIQLVCDGANNFDAQQIICLWPWPEVNTWKPQTQEGPSGSMELLVLDVSKQGHFSFQCNDAKAVSKVCVCYSAPLLLCYQC
jgi:hypothetical protein